MQRGDSDHTAGLFSSTIIVCAMRLCDNKLILNSKQGLKKYSSTHVNCARRAALRQIVENNHRFDCFVIVYYHSMQSYVICLTCIISVLIKLNSSQEETTSKIENEKNCRERNRLISTDSGDLYRLIDATSGQKLTLQCHYWYDIYATCLLLLPHSVITQYIFVNNN